MRENWIKYCGLATAAALFSASAANAQYSSGFEAVNADADGTILTGQEGYYTPTATSTDFEAYTYAANSWRLPQNPTGGNNFVGGIGQGGGTFERAQRDLAYGQGAWTIGYDIAADVFGTAANNLGSVSIQPFPGSANFIALARWTVLGSTWQADYVWFDAAGAQLTESVADPAFQGLSLSKWYRWETDFNLTTNQITEVRIIDIDGAIVTSVNPVDRYLAGGAAGGQPMPTGYRLFAGAGTAGQGLAFDNVSIVPAPSALALLGLGGLVATRRRR
jgi:hypothetical protein